MQKPNFLPQTLFQATDRQTFVYADSGLVCCFFVICIKMTRNFPTYFSHLKMSMHLKTNLALSNQNKIIHSIYTNTHTVYSLVKICLSDCVHYSTLQYRRHVQDSAVQGNTVRLLTKPAQRSHTRTAPPTHTLIPMIMHIAYFQCVYGTIAKSRIRKYLNFYLENVMQHIVWQFHLSYILKNVCLCLCLGVCVCVCVTASSSQHANRQTKVLICCLFS